MKKLFLVFVVCFLICGCASVNVTKTSKGFFPATNPNEIEILMTKPERGFIELATVTTSGWNPKSMAKMHNSLRAKSAPLGADAVILMSSGLDNSRFYWSSGVAIKYNN